MAYRLWGGRIDIISTHNTEGNYFNELIKEVRAGKLNWSHHYTDFDQALSEGFYRRVCLVKGIEWTQKGEDEYRADAYADYPDQADADEELGCIPRAGTGNYFNRLIIENCQDESIPVIRLTKPAAWVVDKNRTQETDDWLRDVIKPVLDNLPGQRSVYGQDFGRDGDLSVIWILQQESPAKWRTAFILELRKIPFDVQQQIMKYIIKELPLFHHAKFDARGNGQSHAEAAVQDFGQQRVECVMATVAWYAVAFPKYRAAYEDKNIVVPKSEDIIADHRRVILKAGRPAMDDGRDKGSDGQPRHGDSAIAGLMAWMAAMEEGQPAAGESIESDKDAYEPESMKGRRRVSMFR